MLHQHEPLTSDCWKSWGRLVWLVFTLQPTVFARGFTTSDLASTTGVAAAAAAAPVFGCGHSQLPLGTEPLLLRKERLRPGSQE